ncbi:hypothetical protein [Chryseobacterium bernardetii]|uniref:hypothetical protein n=1 Tax=Chryseobacterium bernardetii TaxID=1241978 RepID=UPI000F514748|nr:hypothetical protein [Chryseobacterium bernardetii]AZB33407.1 hypothetical protein EG351_07140 [Chryseobacterium bernardetii]
MTSIERKEILDDFLEKWNYENVESMTLEDYVGIGNKETFCQWVETKTRTLGSIKGLPGSIKFGIYERKNPKREPKYYTNDDKYSWSKSYSGNRKDVFQQIKNDILKIIQLSEVGNFKEIDDIRLSDMFKWKIAFLYSNERLIPIYKREALEKIGNNFGLVTSKKTKVSDIQNAMISNKPAKLDVYQYMWNLYERFGSDKEKKENSTDSQHRKKRTTRKGTTNRNTNSQNRKTAGSYIAEQIHNKIQKELQSFLVGKYGKQNVILEENYIDVKLFQPDFINFYEVKSASYASECIQQAVGQLMSYYFYDSDERIKNLIVVGQYPANEEDLKFINFIKSIIKINIDYLHISIK